MRVLRYSKTKDLLSRENLKRLEASITDALNATIDQPTETTKGSKIQANRKIVASIKMKSKNKALNAHRATTIEGASQDRRILKGERRISRKMIMGKNKTSKIILQEKREDADRLERMPPQKLRITKAIIQRRKTNVSQNSSNISTTIR